MCDAQILMEKYLVNVVHYIYTSPTDDDSNFTIVSWGTATTL